MTHPINNKWEWMTKESFGSHLPLLIEALCIAPPGPVLEIGMGEYSTLLLHQFRHHRKIVSIDHDIAYVSTFAHLHEPDEFWTGGGRHRIMHVDKDYTNFRFECHRWAVALVDHTEEGRIRDLVRLVGCADIVVAHDAQPECPSYSRWPYQRHFPRFGSMAFSSTPHLLDRLCNFEEEPAMREVFFCKPCGNYVTRHKADERPTCVRCKTKL